MKTNITIKFVGSILAVVGFVTIAIALPTPVHAAPNQLDGTVYWDQDGDGVRDVTEPGIEGLIVRFGGNSAPSTTTDVNGAYTLTGVSGNATLEVFTGWFRSQCNSISCAVGPGVDNDFTVNNQFIQIATSGTTGGTFNVGLVPDWGSTYPITSTNTARPIDVAARATYTQGCNAGTAAQRLCNPGDMIRMRTTILNQGTDSISNPVFALQVPAGHTIDDSSWPTVSGTNQAHPDANSITVVQPFNAALGYGIYQLNGTLPAGASSGMFVNIAVGSGAIGSSTPYATADPRDKQVVLQVLGMDQTGDPDSVFCLGGAQNYAYGSCALTLLGDHDKTVTADHTDGATWNVSGAFVARADSIQIDAPTPPTPVDVCQQSRDVTALLTVTNTSTGDSSLRNIEIALAIPSGLSFDVADNPGWFIGGDDRPHTFVNLAMLPGGSQDIPVVLTVNEGITAVDNGTSALELSAEIVAYDTSQVTVQLAGNSAFIPGSMTGTLLALGDVTVTGENCVGGSPSSNSDADVDAEVLASTGMNQPGLLLIALSGTVLSLIVLAKLYVRA